MKLSISCNELTKEKGTWLATVNWFEHDGGKNGTPGTIKYGDSKEEAYERLKKSLLEKGHEVVEK